MQILTEVGARLSECVRNLPYAHALTSSEGTECLEIDIDGAIFLLTRTANWQEGLALIGELGWLTDDASELMAEALENNVDRALGNRPMFAIDRQSDRAVLTCVQRIPFIEVHTPWLVESLLEVAALRRQWQDRGWLIQDTTGEPA